MGIYTNDSVGTTEFSDCQLDSGSFMGIGGGHFGMVQQVKTVEKRAFKRLKTGTIAYIVLQYPTWTLSGH